MFSAVLIEPFSAEDIGDDKYKVIGDDTDFKFTIRFQGSAGFAALNMQHARRCLRDEEGKYKDLQITKPAGGTTQIFINPDRNPRMQKTIRASKTLANIFKEMYPDTRWHVNRDDGEISKGWVPIVKLDIVPGDSPTRLLWNVAGLSNTDINKEDVVAKFTDAARGKVTVTWSV